MNDTFLQNLYQRHLNRPDCPPPKTVIAFLSRLLATLFPAFSDHKFTSFEKFSAHAAGLRLELYAILAGCECSKNISIDEKVAKFFKNLPVLHERLLRDIRALEQGDPAAKSQDEVIRTYPGFYAIATHRIAHLLHQIGIQTIPRILSEHAHSHTGIDIHPAATIGDSFCIDHGTGIVIGETSIIGNHVKVYQGVTLGALSVRKEDAEQKRHPTIEDHVVLYAGATILGGNTVIGHHSVVGGNVWITKSIEPHSKVYYQAKMNYGENEELDLFVYKTKN